MGLVDIVWDLRE